MNPSLIEKYNIAVPRYTSYPAVPHWNSVAPTQEQWLSELSASYSEYPELSMYIHLPFCEALCTYCGCNKRITKNHGVESPYIDAVLKEWSIYQDHFDTKPVIKEIHLGGGTPTFFDPENLRRLIQTILDQVDLAEDYEFSFEAHPNSTSREHLQTLFDIGFRRISIGVQDVSPDILKAINRQQTSEEVANVTTWAREIGYTSVNYDIIYGLPFQRPMDVWETTKFIAQHKPDRLAFYSYAHVPWKSAGQRAFTIDDIPAGRMKNDLYSLGRYLLEVEGYESVGMDHFCLPTDSLFESYQQGNMHRNFMGYTTNYTRCSVALGASSISDSWGMYVQNEKHIETYQEIVNSGKLPIIKGHALGDKEKNTREHILDLMCRDETSWTEINALNPDKTTLLDLAKDDLVTYTDNSIKVSEAGRYFIRNICSTIDPLFKAPSADQSIFSKAI